MKPTQDTRLLSLDTPLGKDALLVHSLTLTEQLGRPFEMELDLRSPDPAVKFEDIVGQRATVRLALQDDGKRFFNGFISRFGLVRSEDRYTHYRATLVPWLWFLTRTSDCRIFQNKTIPKIIEEVFVTKKFSDYRLDLTGTYPSWENCVQYRETDFRFVSRLMEQEGMFYFFEHEDGKHTLVLTDTNKNLKANPDCSTVPYRGESHDRRELEFIFNLMIDQQVEPGAFALNEFDFTKPQAALRTRSDVTRKNAKADYEIYDYPGEYEEKSEGQAYAKVRLEELQAEYEVARAQSNTRGLTTGCLFTLKDHPRRDLNKEYLLTSTTFNIVNDPIEADPGGGSASYECSFTAIDSAQAFRTPQTTPKPVIQGPQTAIVVGPKGEEIHTDKYGRVKLQFPWDRYGKQDEKSSCWVRPSHAWAGKGWGGVCIPRIGQEVIVEFLEGDPDRPIITGRVYNADCMPPYGLPGGAVVSGVKSNTHKGSGYNEISLNDTAASEMITIHGQHDMGTVIEHDQTSTIHNNRTDRVDVDDSESVGHDQKCDVGNDQSLKVGHDQKIEIGNDQTLKIGHDQKTDIGNDQSIKIGNDQKTDIVANRKETVGADETMDVTGNRTRSVKGNESVTVKGKRDHSVLLMESITVGLAQNITVGAAQSITVIGLQSTNVGVTQSISVKLSQSNKTGTTQTNDIGTDQTNKIGAKQNNSVGADRSSSVGGDDSLSVKKKLTIDAGDEITIKTGDASIHMKKDGTIEIKGKEIKIQGSGDIKVKSDKDIGLKGNNVTQN